MLTTLLATLIMAPTAYTPSGPKLVFTMTSGKSFTITTDKKGSPKTVAHIISLVKKKFYDGIRIHRVETWVVQWGDPGTKKGIDQTAGTGGSGTPIPFESNPAPFTRGVVGIASTGEKVGGDCQLFVVTKDSTFLNGNYAIAGIVSKGMSVIDDAKVGDQIKNVKVVDKK